ncbi:MAG: response regulator, partial [Hyphomicrobiaceae bacterium]
MTCLKILVVDNDRDNADSLAELFELEGHEVATAYNGQDAIDIYKEQDFDVAFMDVMMPGKNGVESFLEIRRIKPDATVYMMTGYSVEQLLQQATDNGALGVLKKPLDIQDVMGALANVLPEGVVLVANSDQGLGQQLRELIGSTGKKCELVT